MSPEDEPGGVVGYRLRAVEDGMKTMRAEMNARFDGLQREVQNAAYVPMNLYASERETFRESLKALNTRVDNQRTLVMWSIGLMVTSVGVVVALVRAFG